MSSSSYGDALIGDTGFVGQTLSRQHNFSALFNSQSINAIGEQTYGTLLCAAAPGSMFEANNFPDLDDQRIDALIAQLGGARARQFVLISSIAVLADFAVGDDEGTSAFQQVLAYGRNRRRLEAFCETHFERCLVVRLPALYGTGLRKNFIFDLMNPIPTMLSAARLDTLLAALPKPQAVLVAALYAEDPATRLFKIDRPRLDAYAHAGSLADAVTAAGFSATGFHNPDSTYQFYGLSCLWADIGTALAADLSHIHLVTEPVTAAAVHLRLTGQAMPASSARLHQEDMHTRHAALWDRTGSYLAGAEEVLTRLAGFFQQARFRQ
jgi:hypothetical protein